MMQEYLFGASVWNLLTKQSQNGSFLKFPVQWKWYPPELPCQAFSYWFQRLWTWQKKERFFSSRWLIFGERVASPSYIPGQRCIKSTQTHVNVVICISTEMTSVKNTGSVHDSFLVTVKYKYNGNGDTLKLSYLIKGYGDRDIMKLRLVGIYIMSLLLFYGSLPRPPEFMTIKKNLKGLIFSELELRDEATHTSSCDSVTDFLMHGLAFKSNIWQHQVLIILEDKDVLNKGVLL